MGVAAGGGKGGGGDTGGRSPAPRIKAPRLVSDNRDAPVTYPLKLTKVIISMRPEILSVDEQRPVENRTIHLDRIGVLDPPPRW